MKTTQFLLALALATTSMTSMTSIAHAQSDDAAAVAVETIEFGDDASEWANDNECDDRRFRGYGMARELDVADTQHDGTDCKALYELGEIKLWNFDEALEATQCDAIAFGDDSSDWARDGECDDLRFEGASSADTVVRDDMGHDAKDCRAACNAGSIAVRNY